ncbi:MAG: UDP-N-acetylmuramate dehydrogenase [Thiotrichales bacterium]|jgi:UDP-N-acetylmuramate dehydrogenase|nr:UDP-N-acetylmuramate dehydrogenase [Thiotrichales bacterium]MBT3613663.1 UDP-N-acetylmuramate dehydrogenase [Thiotrichales bacterium]MBT3753178.1 UDP-N-acetylmuramate dehydrogenase [Thiotrichales bacterium]MBT3837752.1 UDP-N-acetylmuramate dehydrogenase [Thiotrichales bacterium]MBT4152438.1 UDP-N-acetylmuramate dehydrogenase [Thiotrichales bacterium]
MKILYNKTLAEYTSWGVGGRVTKLYIPDSITELSTFLEGLERDVVIEWIGRGSNLLVRDGGVDGVVILLREALQRIDKVQQMDALESKIGKVLVRAEAGVSLAKLSRVIRIDDSAHEGQQSTLSFLAGIPGTLGGALAMNAGAFGSEIWSWIDEVEVMQRSGKIVKRKADEYNIGYRSAERINRAETEEDEWFVAATLVAATDTVTNTSSLAASVNEQLKQRNRDQPMGEKSCGSVFKNPPNDFAGRLIESAGLKGKSVGGAAISARHANFIINSGDATAEDIEQLMDLIEQQVMDTHGVKLQREVRVIGSRYGDEK